MRVATLLLSAFAIAPSVIFAAPINPAHYEELEARWNLFKLNAQQKQNMKDFGRGFAHGFKTVMKKAAPVALALAPMIIKREEEEMQLLKREEEQHLQRRISERAKNFWKKVGHGAQKVWNTLGPTAVELTAKHYKMLPPNKRDLDQHLDARSLEFADATDALVKRDYMPLEFVRRGLMPEELVERDAMLEELVERDFTPIELEALERRGISDGAKRFWRKVGHGAGHVFEQLGPLALQMAAHRANYE